MPAQSPGNGGSTAVVKQIGLALVPRATSPPSMVRPSCAWLLTQTPGSIVSVAPAWTITLPVSTYGEPAALQTVFAEIVPLTVVPGPSQGEPGERQIAADVGELIATRKIGRASCRERV